MSLKTVLAISTLAVSAFAMPGGSPPSYPSPPAYSTSSTPAAPTYPSKPTTSPSKPTPTSTWTTKTSSAPATTSAPGGDGFTNQCLNFGLSLLDCIELGNIGALNGNTIVVGGPAPSSGAAPVNNGQQFLNQCKNFGLSVADCAELLNLQVLNGNTIDISLADLTSLVSALGISATLLPGLLSGLGLGNLVPTALLPLPTGLL